MRIFVSHAWEDKPAALALSRLPAFVDAWVDVRELHGGQSLDPTIIEAIEDSHVFVTLVSRLSMTKPYVNKELAWALAREARKDRVFILPVLLEPGIVLAESPSEPFRQLGSRLFIQVPSADPAGLEAACQRIAETLFHWASDWLDRFEPRGDHDRRFVDELEAELQDYRFRLFAVKAALAWPIETLVQPEALAHLVSVKDRYNAFTDDFSLRLGRRDDELRWRFGVSALKAYARLRAFVIDEVFQGAAFALNDAIESINAYESRLQHDAAALADADARRAQRVAALEPVLDELVERSTEFLDLLRG